jgi:hypothetical protein
VARPRGPPVIGLVPAGVSRPPVNEVAPPGVGRPRLNGGSPAGASAACSSKIPVLQNLLIAMQMQLREMLRVVSRLVHGKTAAAAAAARPSATCEPMREHRLTWNAWGGLADREAQWRP